MKIAMICSQVPPAYGGAGQQAMALSTRLAEAGEEVTVISENQLDASRSELIAGVRVLRLNSRLPFLSRDALGRSSEVLRSIWFCLWIVFRLSRTRYDVVHVHGSYWYSVAAALMARIRRIPLIVKVTRLGEDDAGTVAGKCIGPVPIGKLYGFALSNASVTIALSQEIAERQKEIYPSVPVLQWPNGVDTEFFRRDPAERETTRKRLGLEDKFVVLFVGYLVPHKGVGTLIEAWKEFSGDRNAALVLAGPDKGFYRELDQDLIGFARSAEDVLIPGKVERSELKGLYASADLFVLPTKAEGMPNSLLEALSSGLPAIATRVPGPIEIGEKSTGIRWMEENTRQELLRQLELAYEDRDQPDFRGVLGSEFSLGALTGDYLALYESLVKGQGV